jgi:ectoine hydroxylase-related dioxygenase (phytanoyl-CoA dioxygenase family)
MDHLEIEAYRRDGFVILRSVCSLAGLLDIRSAYDELLANTAGSEAVNLLAGAIPQIASPSLLHDTFRTNEAIENGKERAATLMGVRRAKMCFDMLIYKEPGNIKETPWHQDRAYDQAAPSCAPNPLSSVQIWIALDDVDAENGCMHFLPQHQHLPTLPHEKAGGLALQFTPDTALDFSTVVACPLRAGDATAHGPNTPHFTTGNRSADRPRRAYIITFAPDY